MKRCICVHVLKRKKRSWGVLGALSMREIAALSMQK